MAKSSTSLFCCRLIRRMSKHSSAYSEGSLCFSSKKIVRGSISNSFMTSWSISTLGIDSPRSICPAKLTEMFRRSAKSSCVIPNCILLFFINGPNLFRTLSKLFHPQFTLDGDIILHINNLLNAEIRLLNNSNTVILWRYLPSYAAKQATGAISLERKSWQIYTFINSVGKGW